MDAGDGTILGLVDGQFLQRSSGRKALRKALPIEEKESFRWLQGADASARLPFHKGLPDRIDLQCVDVREVARCQASPPYTGGY